MQAVLATAFFAFLAQPIFNHFDIAAVYLACMCCVAIHFAAFILGLRYPKILVSSLART